MEVLVKLRLIEDLDTISPEHIVRNSKPCFRLTLNCSSDVHSTSQNYLGIILPFLLFVRALYGRLFYAEPLAIARKNTNFIGYSASDCANYQFGKLSEYVLVRSNLAKV